MKLIGDNTYIDGDLTAYRGIFEIPDGPPLVVASQEENINLNANYLQGYLANQLAIKANPEVITGPWRYSVAPKITVAGTDPESVVRYDQLTALGALYWKGVVTTNYLPKSNGSYNFGDSVIRQEASGFIGVGIPAEAPLHVAYGYSRTDAAAFGRPAFRVTSNDGSHAFSISGKGGASQAVRKYIIDVSETGVASGGTLSLMPYGGGVEIGVGTGLLKATSGLVSYITDNSANWNTAYSWGDYKLRSVLAGTGLTGGGTLAADRTLTFDTTWGDARYALLSGMSGYVPATRTLQFQGTAGRVTSNFTSPADLSINRAWVFDLATAGTAGSYRSVTTDAYGRVISGTNPTTVAGYGITDLLAQTLVGYTAGTNTVLTSSHTFLNAFRDLQAQITGSTHAPITLGTANGLSLVGQALSLGLSATGATGALSSTDWNTFNNKQAALSGGTGYVFSTAGTIAYHTQATVNYWTKTGSDLSYTAGIVGIGVTPTNHRLHVANAFAKTDTSRRNLVFFGSNESNTAHGLSIASVGHASLQASRRVILDVVENNTGSGGTLNMMPYVGSVVIGSNDVGVEALEVTGKIKLSGALLPNGAAGTSGQYFKSAGGSVNTWGAITSGDVTGGLGFTPHSGTLTSGYVPYATGSTTLADSPIRVSGANVGIGGNATNQLTITHTFSKTSTSTARPFAMYSNDVSNPNVMDLSMTGGATQADRTFQFQTSEAGVAYGGTFGFQPNGGNVLIGSLTPTAYRFSVSGDINTTVGYRVSGSFGSSGQFLKSTGSGSAYGSLSSGDVTGALGFTPYNATNPSGYITGINSGNVTAALGFTPYNATNPNGYISGINSGNVTTALGFTPYNATNPSGFITASSSDNLTNKTGNVSQWNNNSNYVSGFGTDGYFMKYSSGGTASTNSTVYDNGSEVNFGSSRSFGVEGAAAFRNDLHAHGAVRFGSSGTHGTLIIHNASSATIDPYLAFEVRSTTKGALPCPQMTYAQRSAISSSAGPMLVYQTDVTPGGAGLGLKLHIGAGLWFSISLGTP